MDQGTREGEKEPVKCAKSTDHKSLLHLYGSNGPKSRKVSRPFDLFWSLFRAVLSGERNQSKSMGDIIIRIYIFKNVIDWLLEMIIAFGELTQN